MHKSKLLLFVFGEKREIFYYYYKCHLNDEGKNLKYIGVEVLFLELLFKETDTKMKKKYYNNSYSKYKSKNLI